MNLLTSSQSRLEFLQFVAEEDEKRGGAVSPILMLLPNRKKRVFTDILQISNIPIRLQNPLPVIVA